MSHPLDDDALDLVVELVDHDVDFMLVGAHALAVHGIVRATADVDLWVRASRRNAERLVAALDSFGAPMDLHGVGVQDFARPGTVYQIGVAPRRIDILTQLSGIEYTDAWPRRSFTVVDGLTVGVLGIEDLIQNKRATGRLKDVADVEALEALSRKS